MLLAVVLGASGCGGDGPNPHSTTAPLQPATAPPAAAQLARAGDPGTRFGYNENLFPGSPGFALLPGSGAELIRIRLSWNWVEREPGQLDWSTFDAIYDGLLTAGARPLWVLVEAPCWAGVPDIPCNPEASAGAVGVEHADDLGRFAANVATRYPQSFGLEIGNEVNDSRFWPNGQGPDAYAELLRAAADAVHAAPTPVPVVASGLFPVERAQLGKTPWRDYAQAIIDGGAAQAVDALAFHPYARAAPGRDPGLAVANVLREFTDYVAARGAGSVPVWVTEVGLTTAGPRGLSPREQASGLVSILQRLEAEGVPVVVIHRLLDEANPSFPLEAGFGVASAGATALKPAYCALGRARGLPCG